VYGDANSKNLWENLDIARLRGVVVSMREETAKLHIIESLRNRGFKGNISAMIESKEQGVQLANAGVSTMCSPLIQAGVELAEKIVTPGVPETANQLVEGVLAPQVVTQPIKA
jgi:hypothetical protein